MAGDRVHVWKAETKGQRVRGKRVGTAWKERKRKKESNKGEEAKGKKVPGKRDVGGASISSKRDGWMTPKTLAKGGWVRGRRRCL